MQTTKPYTPSTASACRELAATLRAEAPTLRVASLHHDYLTNADRLETHAEALEIVAEAGAAILEVRGIRRNASDGGAWMLLDGTGDVEVAPRLPEALTSTQVLDLVASVKAAGFATEDAHLDDLEA